MKIKSTIAGVVLALVAGVAHAGPEVMNFAGLQANGEYVNNYYDGGSGGSYNGGSVDSGGQNYGVVWVGALAGGAPNGLWGNTANEPTGPNTMGFLSSSSAYMNVASGFTTGFSFYYSAHNTPGAIQVYSGLNGTGNLLASLNLAVNGKNPNFSQGFSNWTPIGVSFAGTARSADFSGTANQIVFNDVTLNSSVPLTSNVPEPSSLALLGIGVVGLGLFRLKRQSRA